MVALAAVSALVIAALALPCCGLVSVLASREALAAEAGEHRTLIRHKPKWALMLQSMDKDKKQRHDTEEKKTTYFGLPPYYEGRLPPNYLNMSFPARQDFYHRVERWHQLIEDDKGECRAPEPGEKVFYFIQHGMNLGDSPLQVGHTAEKDSVLDPIGQVESENIATDPLVKKALLSGDPRYKPQVVIMSPARKAIQTALIGLGPFLRNATWDFSADICGFGLEGIHGKPHPEMGVQLLQEVGVPELLERYNQLPPNWVKDVRDHKPKWANFVEQMVNRTEERFVVVTHNQVIKLAGFPKVSPGQVVIAGMSPKGKFRALSPPDCWP
mmetsp:Transcript_78927/g.209610  ORF Transcript_78927/g.209610 Transcript_78927/m.209610 type:complete len:327 (-) Transcript_78927:110-1090(-)